MSDPIDNPVRDTVESEQFSVARKERTGIVTAARMHKTCIVRSETRVPHSRFGKIQIRRKKFYVHDPNGEASVGDVVSIVESRPISKLKCWRLLTVIKKAGTV